MSPNIFSFPCFSKLIISLLNQKLIFRVLSDNFLIENKIEHAPHQHTDPQISGTKVVDTKHKSKPVKPKQITVEEHLTDYVFDETLIE